MRKGFVIVIGVAATGVMALGAQTATSTTVEPVDSVPPDLQLSGDKTQRQGGIHTPGTDSLHLGRPVLVKASCGELSVGPPVSDPLQESVPPEPWAANLPDTACALSAEGKVFAWGTGAHHQVGFIRIGDRLRPAHGGILGPHVACTSEPPLTACRWQSGGTTNLYLDLTKETKTQVRRALDDGKKVRANVTVEATDAAGNVATAKRTITLVK